VTEVPPLTRRATLRAAAAISWATAAAPSLSASASAAVAADPLDQLRLRWVSMLTGAGVVDTGRAPYRTIALGVADTARRWLKSIAAPTGDPDALWDDPPSGAGEFNTRITADRLRVIALAWATPGTDLSASTEVEALLLTSLEWFNRRRYNATIPQTGNWWEWEIGIPLALTDLLLLLHAPLARDAPSLRDALSAALARFTPDAAKGTGANRVWRSHVVLLNAIVARDAGRLVAARDAVPATFAAVDAGDGFHRDGSFLQHRDLSYNGGYGYELLIRSALLFYLLDGSAWPFDTADVGRLRDWISSAFAPLMYRGALMDMTRGRNISRARVSDLETGRVVIVAVLYIAEVLRDRRLAAIAKGWIAGLHSRYDLFAYDPLLPAYWTTPHMAWMVRRAISDRRIPPAPDPVETRAYPDMARFVHRRPGFTLALAMHSKRIRNFETINGENLTGWYTGWGMTTLYRPDRPDCAGDFWPTVDPYRLPGVTLDRRPRPPGTPSGRNGSDQVGALAFDGIGMAAMNNRTDDGFAARIGWYAAGDAVICVGSGIRSDTAYPVETVMANQPLPDDPADAGPIVDGRAVALSPGEAWTLPGVRWTHSASHGGLILLAPATVYMLDDRRSGAWSDINRQDSSPRAVATRTYRTVWLDHGVAPAGASYAYALLPAATPAATRAVADRRALRVITNTPALHHVAIDNDDEAVAAYTFWEAGRSADGAVGSSAPILLMTRRRGRRVDLGLVDSVPADGGTIRLTLALPGATATSHDPGLRIGSSGDAIHLDLARAALRGRTVRAVLLLP